MRDFLGAEAPARFSPERVGEQTAAHADAPVNSPHRQLDSGGLQGFAPGENVLIDAVHQRAVEVEQEGGCPHDLCRTLHLLAGVSVATGELLLEDLVAPPAA